MGKAKKRYYAVARGHRPGIYTEWYGEEGAEVQIKGFTNALFKGFKTLKDAKEWLGESDNVQQRIKGQKKGLKSKSTPLGKFPDVSSEKDQVVMFTDGGCIRNPGPGGYGVVILYGGHRKELSGGFCLTTNNRMEMMACIVGLRALKYRCSVTLYSDSRYVVNGIKKGWAKRWRAHGWMRNKMEAAENADLWPQLLALCEKHRVEFKWVKGHAGNTENELCDQLATQAALKKGLPPDTSYEEGTTKTRPCPKCTKG